MKPIRVRGHDEHPLSRWGIAVEIDDLWHHGGYYIYRLPEIFKFAGKAYLVQPKEAECWPEVQPEAAREWSIDRGERRTSYHIRFYDGLKFGVEVKSRSDAVDFEYVIVNGTETTGFPDTQSCLMLWTSPPFVDRRHDRTFIWVDGKPVSVRKLTPTPEEMKRWSWVSIGVKKATPHPLIGNSVWGVNEAPDHGLIAVKSSTDGCWLGLGWANAGKLMARTTIPCLHSESAYPEIGSCQSARARGRLYFHDGSLKELVNRFRSDEADETIRVEVL